MKFMQREDRTSETSYPKKRNAFPLVITNSSCGSMKNRHTLTFYFSDTLTFLITHSIIQLGIVVGKNISHLKGRQVNLKPFGILDHYTIWFASVIIYNNQNKAYSIDRDWKKNCRQFCSPRPENGTSERAF